MVPDNENPAGEGDQRVAELSQPDRVIEPEDLFLKAAQLHENGQLDQAAQIYEAVLRKNQTHVGALCNIGIIWFQRGHLAKAESAIREAVRLSPELAVAHNALAVVLRNLAQFEEAQACCREALRLAPEYAEAYNTLGDTLAATGEFGEAEACCREALRIQPNYAEAHNNLGVVLISLGRAEEAESCFREALRLKPGNLRAYVNLSAAFITLGRLDEAELCCREALRLNPVNIECYINLGTILVALCRVEEAEGCYREAARLNPANAVAHTNLGDVLVMQQKLSEAVAQFECAAALRPDDLHILASWFNVKQRICDWSDYLDAESRFRNGVRGPVSPSVPFKLLVTSSSAAEQLACASQAAAELTVLETNRFPQLPLRAVEKLRLGYFSSSFYAHATSYLIAGLIEQHDRQRFEVIAYSATPDDGSPIRRRLSRSFDRFVDLSDGDASTAAGLIHSDSLDILINLDGFKLNSKPKIFAYRPAPIQVNYLGYPSTMGANFMDYIIVDPFVVPPDQQCFFSERLIHLPYCYQCNDDKRKISVTVPTRNASGLPNDAFVFCCFNDHYKINPQFFDIWMRLLRATPDSVLWLLDTNDWARVNLIREARSRGIETDRLIFAPRLPLAEHLARHRLADLFLDTLPYNAHTSASDALWAGLPLLTCAGNTFAGRVGGSLLQAIGLSELITTSLDQYEGLALKLTRDPELLARLRCQLLKNRHIYPLFNTADFASGLEAAYLRMREIRKVGLSPTSFSVLPSGDIIDN